MEDYNQLYKNFLFNIITEMVPYVKNLEVVPKTIEKGKIALEMEVGKAHCNHVNSAHAGALFTFLETLAGGVLVSFSDIMSVSVLRKEGKAEYCTPGLGKLEGRASLTAEERSNALACLEADGKVKPVIRAEILNGKGEPVAAGTFTYSLKVMR